MTSSQPLVGWEPPPQVAGPAPGIHYAPHGQRLIAYILDTVIVAVMFIVVAVIGYLAFGSGVTGPADNPTLSTEASIGFSVLFLIVSIVALLYFPWFWVRGGATPGMKPFKLRVVNDADGLPIGWGKAILRVIGMAIGGAVFYLGYVWVLIDSRRRGWHDLIAGTVVIKDDPVAGR
jgi:uncharacterized RDD family membrane protein YckC